MSLDYNSLINIKIFARELLPKNGARYTFFDNHYKEIVNQTLESLSEAKYYTKEGESQFDMFYCIPVDEHGIVDMIKDPDCWGFDNMNLNTLVSFGQGKHNTKKLSALSFMSQGNKAIEKLEIFNNSMWCGYDDWYIPSVSEVKELYLTEKESIIKKMQTINSMLRISNVQLLDSKCMLWTSTEATKHKVYTYEVFNNRSTLQRKLTESPNTYLIPIRSF